MNQEIKVTKCLKCPKFKAFENNPIIDGVCESLKTYIEIYDDSTIHPNCPLKGKSITYKIGDDEK